MYTTLKRGEHKFSSNLGAIAPYFRGIIISSRYANMLKFS